MKGIIKKITMIAITMIATLQICSINVWADEYENHEFINFSSDRSTYFFRINGGNNDKVFFDFYSPFDPTIKVESYDPISMYELDSKYYLDKNNNVMINLDELKKLYDPYFSYEINEDILNIYHTVYDKMITDGFGERSTSIDYTKKVWNVNINLADDNINSGVYNYTEYLPVIGGRNKSAVNPTEINNEKSIENKEFIFEDSKVEIKDNELYIPIESLMSIMGKVAIEEEGYLAIQQENLADVTVEVNRDTTVSEVKIPRASNIWSTGTVEEVDENYTWADYMNDIADGKRKTGWISKSFYIPTGDNFKDGNGESVNLKAGRIVPFTMYIPTTYDKDTTRLTYMLHGGTGNENTPMHRLMDKDEGSVDVDKYAEKYNHIIVSPNGWVENPVWRENEALYSFEKSYEMVMNEFGIDKNKVFIAGNSLGGKGTLELAMRFSDRFAAMAVSAPKITTRDKTLGVNTINIEDTIYNLSDISDMPSMIIQGTMDTTTSFKTQIGSEQLEGAIKSAIIPKLSNATYITVENGTHSYAYGLVLTSIFDFFESTIENEEVNIDTVELIEDSKKAYINDSNYKLGSSVKLVENIPMISLSDLEKIYGNDFKVYPIKAEDSSSDEIEYYTITYKNSSMNVEVDKKIYRNNMERYKEDANLIPSGARSDEDYLKSAPSFDIAPFEKNNEVFVQVDKIASYLGMNITIREKENNIIIYFAVSAMVIIAISIILYKKKYKK